MAIEASETKEITGRSPMAFTIDRATYVHTEEDGLTFVEGTDPDRRGAGRDFADLVASASAIANASPPVSPPIAMRH